MIKLYYHIYTSTNKMISQMLIDQQLRRIRNAGIGPHNTQMNCVITGPWWAPAKELVERFGGFRILETTNQDEEEFYESRTLRYIWQDAKLDDGICFMHTKGSAYLSGEKHVNGWNQPRNITAINSWRWAMEYYTLDLWQERINNLNTATDTEGIMMYLDPFWHYSGNFWWAKGSHIRRLPDPTRMEAPYGARMNPRDWLMINKGHHMNYFDCLTQPRSDGRAGPFRMHEDDCMSHVLAERKRLTLLKDALRRNDGEAVARYSR